MSKKYAIFITALFCLFVGVFMAAIYLVPDRTFSELENRSLQQLPSFSLEAVRTGKFMTDFEKYCNDQFFLRDGWVSMKSTAERLAGKQENNGAYFGKEDTLISRFDRPDEKRLEGNIGYVNQFAANAGVPVYFSLVPSSAAVWADRLPSGAPSADQKAILDAAAAGSNAVWYNTYTKLWDHRSEELYYRTDHHWTSLGAYYGYTALMEALGMEPVPLEHYQKETVSDSFYGTVFSSSGVRWVKPDKIDLYVSDPGVEVTSWFSGKPEQGQLYAWDKLEGKDKYTFFMGGNQALGVVKNPHVDGPKLLIVRDSYTDSMVPFLTAHFSEIHLIDLRYYRYSIPQYIRDNGIDAAAVLYSVANFTSDTNLFTLRQE